MLLESKLLLCGESTGKLLWPRPPILRLYLCYEAWVGEQKLLHEGVSATRFTLP